jgi:uncharacterized membrane protein YeiH
VANETYRILYAADMAGTLVFAVEGALAGGGDLDLLGLFVLAFATALGGGIVRDVLIGDVPPAALKSWRYAAVAFTGGAIYFFLHEFVETIPPNLLMMLDAAGLSIFAIAGTEKALLYKMHPFIAVLLGTITGVGGGTIRDVFLAQVPRVLQADVYATAALAGSVVMVVGRKLRLPDVLSALLGGLVCYTLRVVSVMYHWNLPKLH